MQNAYFVQHEFLNFAKRFDKFSNVLPDCADK